MKMKISELPEHYISFTDNNTEDVIAYYLKDGKMWFDWDHIAKMRELMIETDGQEGCGICAIIWAARNS